MPTRKPLLLRFGSLRALVTGAICAVLLVAGFPPQLAAASGSQLPSSLRSQGTSTAGATKTAFRVGLEEWGQSLSFNPYAPAGYVFGQYVSMPLAILSSSPSSKLPNQYFYPELAKSWTLGKTTITVHLRPGAKWQNGTPVTSADVKDSLILAGEDYDQAWSSISQVTTPNSHTVLIDLRADSVPLNVWTNVVQMAIVPVWEYKSLVPSQAEQWLQQYWSLYKPADPSGASVTAANNSPGGKQIAKLAAEIPKYAPSKLIGDGPYEFVNANSNQVLLKKWPGFWDAKKIVAPWMELVGEADPGTTFGDLMGSRLDAETYSIFTDPDISALEHSQYGRYDKAVSAGGNASVILFHLADYPYNILDVRKALAYLINRPKLTHLESGGEAEQNQTMEVSDGLTNPMTNRFLTKQQRKSLQAYNYNPAKATKLLESVGFHKRGGSWYTPKGKPWTISLYVESSQDRVDNDSLAISAMWRQAGIKTTVNEVQPAVFTQQEKEGEYAVSDNFNDVGSVNPLQEIEDTLITYNYPLADAGNGSSSNDQAAIGIGPVATVPGLGKVNIESALSREVQTATASQWSKYTWDWARFENEQLPGIGLTSTDMHLLYSVNRYTDFPPISVQRTAGFSPVLWQQLGFLKLRNVGS